MPNNFDPDSYLSAAVAAPPGGGFDPDEFLKEKPSLLESAARGAGQGLSFGLIDEGTAALESTFSDKKYDKALAESRKAYHEAEQANPIAYNVGDVGGSIATAFIPGLGALNAGKGARLAEVAGKAALQGGLTGFGKSEREGLDLAKDTATGAVIGGALGTAGHGIAKGVGKAADLYDDIGGKEGLSQISQAFREGAKQGRELGGVDIGNIPGVSQVSQGISGVKSAIAAAKDLAKTRKDFSETAQALQKTFGPGAATDLSQDDVLMFHLLEEGIAGEPNAAHKLVASKFASAHGGNAEQYLDLIKRSADDLADARGFDVIKAGEELAPDIQGAFTDVRKASGKQYEGLKDSARSQYELNGSYPLGVISKALKQSERYESISDKTRAVLRDAYNELNGHGTKPFKSLSGAEKFDRILDVKQRLGKTIKWASQNELPEGQQILADTYGHFQRMLQKLDDMAAADKGYSGFKGLEENLFKKLGTVKRGKIQEFDPIKLEALFGGGKQSRGMMKQIEKARQMLQDGRLPEESAARVQKMLDTIDGFSSRAGLKRNMTVFRYGDAGPSSPAIQRMAAAAGKDSATTTAVRSPQMFLNIKANASSAAKSIYGKRFAELSQPEKRVISQYALWASKNEGATDIEIKRKIAELMAGKK